MESGGALVGRLDSIRDAAAFLDIIADQPRRKWSAATVPTPKNSGRPNQPKVGLDGLAGSKAQECNSSAKEFNI